MYATLCDKISPPLWHLFFTKKLQFVREMLFRDMKHKFYFNWLSVNFYFLMSAVLYFFSLEIPCCRDENRELFKRKVPFLLPCSNLLCSVLQNSAATSSTGASPTLNACFVRGSTSAGAWRGTSAQESSSAKKDVSASLWETFANVSWTSRRSEWHSSLWALRALTCQRRNWQFLDFETHGEIWKVRSVREENHSRSLGLNPAPALFAKNIDWRMRKNIMNRDFRVLRTPSRTKSLKVSSSGWLRCCDRIGEEDQKTKPIMRRS